MRPDEQASGPASGAGHGLPPTHVQHHTEGGTEIVAPPAPGPLAPSIHSAPTLSRTQVPSDDPPPLPDGRIPAVPGFQILGLLGVGSYGRVYQAREIATGKKVAIKFFTHGPGTRWQTLLEEVRQHAQLDAVQGIIDLKRVDASADPPYYVMAFADRGSLADRLAREKRVSPAEALNLFRQAAQALAYVHAKGICHCDIKPANVLLDARGHALLADFGQAQPTSEGSPALGTLFFMPPEQADRRNTLPDPCWDVYALGAVLFTMLTGERPRFDPSIQDELDEIIDLDFRLERYRRWLVHAPQPTAHHDVPGVDAKLAGIVDRCLRLEPRQRFADAGEILAALSRRDLERRRRPMLLFGLSASILALGITAWTASRNENEALDSYERDLTNQLLDSNRSSASLIAGAVEPQMLRRLQRVTGAVTPDLFAATRDGNRPQIETTLRHLMSTDGRPAQRFAEATVTNDKGRLLGMVRLTRAAEGNQRRGPLVLEEVDPGGLHRKYPHFSWRDWFSGQGDRFEDWERHHPPIREPHVSDPYRSSLDPEGLFVSISAPIRDPANRKAEPIGVLEAAILMPEMNRWLREARIARGGFAVLLDRRRHAVLHPNPLHRPRLRERARRVITPEEEARLFATPLGTIPRYRDPVDHKEYLAGYVRMSEAGLGWIVLVQHDREQVLRPIQDLRDRLSWVGWESFAVTSVLIGGLWGWLYWMVRRLDHPGEG